MNYYATCPHCGEMTPFDKQNCCFCAYSLHQVPSNRRTIEHTAQSRHQRQLSPRRTSNQIDLWSDESAINVAVGQHLNHLRNQAHQQMASRNKGGLRWELVDRHIFSAEVEDKLDELHGRLINLSMESYAEACELRAAGVLMQLKQEIAAKLAQQQLSFDDALKMRRINNNVKMLGEAWKTMEQVFLQEGQLQGLPEPLLRNVLQRTYDEVYNMVFDDVSIQTDDSDDLFFLNAPQEDSDYWGD